MKILLVAINHYPEKTGIGKFQGEMAAWLAAHGHDVRVITAPPYYPAWKVSEGYTSYAYKCETIAGVRVYRAPLYVPQKPTGLKRLVHLLSFTLSSLPLVLGQALLWRPDAIMTTAPALMTAPQVLLAAKLSGARAYLHIQDFEVDAAFGLGLLNHSFGFRIATGIERALLRAFPAVSTISRKMRKRLIEKGVADKRAFLIPNWAGVNDFDPAQGPGDWHTRLKKTPDTVLAVYSGNLGRKQGVEVIVDAARLLRGKPDIHFVICGDGAARQEMEASAKDLTNISFLPLQASKEFIHLMIAADIHLLPQRAEAADLVMPSKLGNILASGKPLVAGAMPGTQLYDAIQGCGLAVPPDNAQEFANAVTTLAADAVTRVSMGVTGRARALAEWSQDSIMQNLEHLLKDDQK